MGWRHAAGIDCLLIVSSCRNFFLPTSVSFFAQTFGIKIGCSHHHFFSAAFPPDVHILHKIAHWRFLLINDDERRQRQSMKCYQHEFASFRSAVLLGLMLGHQLFDPSAHLNCFIAFLERCYCCCCCFSCFSPYCSYHN